MKKATFGAGCFWGIEKAYKETSGVINTQVGYSGGHKENPSYEDVCTGQTGHAEVVEVEYDPGQISYEELVAKFWTLHDPTQVDRQGTDTGSQYRSVIFYHDDEHKSVAEGSKQNLQQSLSSPIATSIEPARPFYRAEEYHQCYFMKK